MRTVRARPPYFMFSTAESKGTLPAAAEPAAAVAWMASGGGVQPETWLVGGGVRVGVVK